MLTATESTLYEDETLMSDFCRWLGSIMIISHDKGTIFFSAFSGLSALLRLQTPSLLQAHLAEFKFAQTHSQSTTRK
jgi:hypothetical protein